jgi:hypothetical protein
VHFGAIGKLLETEPGELGAADAVVGQLEAVVRQKIARRRAA